MRGVYTPEPISGWRVRRMLLAVQIITKKDNKMSRPEFPNCIMPVETIRAIREEQHYYDEDPERYERNERARQERIQEEREMEREMEREYRERHGE